MVLDKYMELQSVKRICTIDIEAGERKEEDS